MSGLASTIRSPIAGNSGASSAAGRATCEMLVSSAVGIGAIDRGLLTAPMVKALSSTAFSILLPMFLGTSIIKTVTTYGLSRSSLAVPLLAIVHSSLLFALTTRIAFPLLRIDADSDDARGSAICSSFCNSSVVPLIFCESLFRDSMAEGGADKLAQSTAYVSLFLVGWSPFFWSFGRSVLIGSGGETAEVDASWRGKVLSSVKTALPPPVVGVLVGMVVATTPLRRLFVSTEEHEAPLAVVYNTAQNFGRAASPLSLLVLVSSLALGAGFGGEGGAEAPAPKVSAKYEDAGEVPFLTRWSLVSLTRFIVSPAVMYGLLCTAARNGVIGTSEKLPMLWFVCMLEACMPPAQNLVVMLQVADKMRKAGEMAAFLFSIYATSMLPIVIILSIALEKFGLA